MRRFRLLHALLIASALLGAGNPKELLRATDQRGAFEMLQSLTRDVGPRLAGSPQDAAAHAWAAARFKAMGLSAVRTEEVPMGRTWIRGREEARLGDRALRVAQMGWTPGTPAKVKAPLALLTAAKARGELAEFKGRIVLAGEPLLELDPPQMQAPLRTRPVQKPHADFPLSKALPALIRAGAQAVLMDSGKSGELLTMDGSAVNTTEPLLPIAFVSHGEYVRLAEAAASGAELELFLGGAFGPAGHTFNTVAELRGSGRPEECVILGAHLDSWDLATGAMDNGAGVASVMEAARLLVELKRPPRRTVRFVLFGAEEQGYLGSAAYVASIRKELGKVSGVFVMDTGGGAVDGVALQGRRKVASTMLKIVAPLRPLGVVDTDLRMESGTDHIPFHTAGVPAFCMEQKQHTYARDHHSEADTLDKVDPAELQQCAVVMAWVGWKVADLPGLLPR